MLNMKIVTLLLCAAVTVMAAPNHSNMERGRERRASCSSTPRPSTALEGLQRRFDQLQTSYNQLTKERDQLQTSYNQLSRERDQLQSSYNQLTQERKRSSIGTVHASPSAELKLERGNCPWNWYSYNGRCFSIVTRHMTWQDAEKNCRNQGGHLASVHSKEELNFIRTLIQKVEPSQLHKWIGLNDLDVEGRWVWADGSKVDYTGWYRGNPNGGAAENCVITYGGDNMHDYPCSAEFTSVCVLGT